MVCHCGIVLRYRMTLCATRAVVTEAAKIAYVSNKAIVIQSRIRGRNARRKALVDAKARRAPKTGPL